MSIKNIIKTNIWGINFIKKKRQKHLNCLKIINQYRNALSKEKTPTPSANRKSAQYTRENAMQIPSESEVIYLGFTFPDHQDKFWLIYTYQPSAWAGCNRKSIFKPSLTSLNSGFSFSWIGCHTTVKELSLPYYLPKARARIIGCVRFLGVFALSILKGDLLKLENKFTYSGSSNSSTKTGINTRRGMDSYR